MSNDESPKTFLIKIPDKGTESHTSSGLRLRLMISKNSPYGDFDSTALEIWQSSPRQFIYNCSESRKALAEKFRQAAEWLEAKQ